MTKNFINILAASSHINGILQIGEFKVVDRSGNYAKLLKILAANYHSVKIIDSRTEIRFGRNTFLEPTVFMNLWNFSWSFILCLF